jgi:4-diphosphocytidyl-2-C-methyl-D-erythritol kinase
MLIDWYDTLHFERRSTNSISREDIDIKLPTEDLCTRAAKALQSATGCTNGVHITLEKRIPHQAGLGGGSSDAASTLMALNKLWSLNLDKSELKAIGLTIGADVPFFIEGHHCWVEGIGDQITPLPESLWPIEGSQFIVVKPRGGIATSSIFSALSLKPEKKTATIQGFAKHVFDFGCNDLETAVKIHCPEMVIALNWLQSFGLKPKMSGSGSAVFAKLAPQSDVLQYMKHVPAEWQVKICNGLNTHPLVGWTKI